jgi:hypothetical protein
MTAHIDWKALVEILLLSGGTPYANFRDLAHAWGRDKGFHHQIVNNVCERRGEVERKRQGVGSRGSMMVEDDSKRCRVIDEDVVVSDEAEMESPHDLAAPTTEI